MRSRRAAAFACLLFSMLSACGQASDAWVQLETAATTSAGIFDAKDRLVRTLWSGRHLGPGKVNLSWDGLDDAGKPVSPDARYEARLLGHHIRYEWEGVIGNTSTAEPGKQIHRAFHPVQDMAFDKAGRGFYVVGYNEQQHALHRMEPGQTQQPSSLGPVDFRRVFRHVATDGELVYFANIGVVAAKDSPFRGTDTFVVAFRNRDGSEYRFPVGRRGQGDFRWASAIDLESQTDESNGAYHNAPTGLAVQNRGKLLLVSHRGSNEVRLFDKRSGQQAGAIAVKAPTDIDVAPDDSVWVICDLDGRRGLAHLRRTGAGWDVVGRISSPGLLPVQIAVSPLDGTVLVADGNSDMLRAYDESGRVVWTLGREGGYRTGGPDVVPDRFSFSEETSFVSFQPDGSFWVGDSVNRRNLHFSKDRGYIEQIQYLPHSYVAAVDGTRPARVFSGFLEFEVDYGRTLRQSWRLVRNWAVGLDSRYKPEFISGLRSVVTLPDGRTYATVFRNDVSGDELVELSPAGLLPLGMRLRPDERLYPDGTIRSHVIRLGLLRIFERTPEPVGADAKQAWSNPRLVAEVPRLTDRDPYFHDVPLIHGINDPSYPRTGNGRIVSFNPGKSQGFHLGLIDPEEAGWVWRASPTGIWRVDLDGSLLTREGTFDLGHGVQYPANVAVADGPHIVYGYHGEAWNGGQADQWLHFHESGLFLGQFGAPVYAHVNALGPVPGGAGNAFTASLVTVRGETYLWHNDESVHGGVHRWHLDGADSIFWLKAKIAPPR